MKKATGQFATRQILAGEPIGSHLLAPTPGSYLAAMLAPGKRAVAINANTQNTAGGFILPNDRVDVLYTGQGSGRKHARSRTILRGVRVLAIDQSTEQTEAGTVLGKTATLELTEAQAEFITAAQATGTLSLSLRPMVECRARRRWRSWNRPRKVRIGRGNQYRGYHAQLTRISHRIARGPRARGSKDATYANPDRRGTCRRSPRAPSSARVPHMTASVFCQTARHARDDRAGMRGSPADPGPDGLHDGGITRRARPSRRGARRRCWSSRCRARARRC